MTLSTRMAIVGALPGSPLSIGTDLGIPPAAVAEYLNDLRAEGHVRKLNARGYAWA